MGATMKGNTPPPGGCRMVSEFPNWLRDSMRRHPDAQTQKKLATILNVYPSTVHYWLIGQTEPDDSNIEKLAGIFGVDTVDILRLLGKAPASAFENIVLAVPEAEIVRDLVELRKEPVYEATIDGVRALLRISKQKADEAERYESS